MGWLGKVEHSLEQCCLWEFLVHRQAKFTRLGREKA